MGTETAGNKSASRWNIFFCFPSLKSCFMAGCFFDLRLRCSIVGAQLKKKINSCQKNVNLRTRKKCRQINLICSALWKMLNIEACPTAISMLLKACNYKNKKTESFYFWVWVDERTHLTRFQSFAILLLKWDVAVHCSKNITYLFLLH